MRRNEGCLLYQPMLSAHLPDRTQAARNERTRRLCLMVVADGVVATHELPEAGRVVIGRTGDSAIAIDSPQVSRRHAAIELGGDRIWVEDLGSMNGTRVRDAAIAVGSRVAVSAGEVIELGTVLALLQHVPAVPTRAVIEDSASGGPVILDPKMVALYRVIDRLAIGALPVLVLGETGVGKEVVAEQLHARSPRRSKPLVRLNCAAFTEELLESELFGHVRGAFTGANQGKQGLLATADGGTVFLDEIGELPLAIQAKLLRVLENGEVLPVGAVRPIRVDVRFVSATNVDLAAAIGRGAFREDLYHRLDGATIVVPPLRARPVEIAPLAHKFLQRAARRHRLAAPELSAETIAWLECQPWPGNVRELRNAIDRALLLSGGSVIEVEHLPARREALLRDDPTPPPTPLEPVGDDPDRARIFDALARCNGNQTRAAKLLGIARSTLVKRLDQYGAPRPRKA
jgi:two-component system, NtrC family, response regulator AtoC